MAHTTNQTGCNANVGLFFSTRRMRNARPVKHMRSNFLEVNSRRGKKRFLTLSQPVGPAYTNEAPLPGWLGLYANMRSAGSDIMARIPTFFQRRSWNRQSTPI